mmetsp:Transcript_37301/g.89711  ORF Transcript_37301/g.89711 Transcript_37301/m.89711 type:complete len:220 (-) Transcript_37301:512-1171(-)
MLTDPPRGASLPAHHHLQARAGDAATHHGLIDRGTRYQSHDGLGHGSSGGAVENLGELPEELQKAYSVGLQECSASRGKPVPKREGGLLLAIGAQDELVDRSQNRQHLCRLISVQQPCLHSLEKLPTRVRPRHHLPRLHSHQVHHPRDHAHARQGLHQVTDAHAVRLQSQDQLLGDPVAEGGQVHGAGGLRSEVLHDDALRPGNQGCATLHGRSLLLHA